MKTPKAVVPPPQTWAEEVFRAGRKDPWKDRKGLKHQTSFPPSAVNTDGSGNVIDMPSLRDKWCFGRPEVYVRQINQTKTLQFHWGQKVVDSTRCGKCPISRACGKLVTERIRSSPSIDRAFNEWHHHCIANGGKREFTGPNAGRIWQRMLQAIADHGPWTSCNDEKLIVDAKERAREGLEKDRRRKRANRDHERERRRILNQPPDRDVVAAILTERDRRCELLEQAAGRPDQPLAIRKISAEHSASTAAFTADVWMTDELLREQGRKSNPSAIAKMLEKMRRNQGKGYSALRQRIRKDLDRIRLCEQGKPPLWKPFSVSDKLVDDEIEEIMGGLDDTFDKQTWGWNSPPT